MSAESNQFQYHPMLKEAAVPNRGLGHGTVPKQPVASPVSDGFSEFSNTFGCRGVKKRRMASLMLAMLDEPESNLGCSIALKTIKSINQYQGNFHVPLASSEATGSEKDSRYYTIPAEPLDAHGGGESAFLFGVTMA